MSTLLEPFLSRSQIVNSVFKLRAGFADQYVIIVVLNLKV